MKQAFLLCLAVLLTFTGILIGCGKSNVSQLSSTQSENSQVSETGQAASSNNTGISQSDDKYFSLLIESETFKTYFQEQDRNFGIGLADTAEKISAVLSNLYSSKPSNKTKLFLFKDLAEAESLGFRSGAPTKTDPNSNSGEFTPVEPLGDGIKLYIPQQNKNFDHGNDAAIEFLVAHEASHRYFYYLFPNIRSSVQPNWLDEGLAMYVGIEASSRFHLFELVIQSFKTSSPPLSGIANLDILRNSSDTSGLFYGEAATIIYFLCANYGKSTVLQVLIEFNKNSNLSQSFQTALGISFTDFEKVWMERIRQIAGQSNTGEEFYRLLITKISIALPPSVPSALPLSEQPDKATFDRYFRSLSIAKVEGEWVGKDGWHQHLLDTNIFSEGDTLVTRGEAISDVQLNIRYYDVAAKVFVTEMGIPPPRKAGNFAMPSVINLAPGEYEQKCYVGGVLVAALPFTVIEEPMTVELNFLRANDARGKFLVQSVFHWTGAADGYYVESVSISYRDQTLGEFFHQSWTTDSIKNAWGGSNFINSGQTKDWTINVYRNDEITKLTVIYSCTVKDKAGNTSELSITQSSEAPN